VPSRRAWQDSILTYLTQNCSVSNSLLKKEKKLYFPSPLPVNVVPKNSLLNELQRHEHGDTPLTLAVRHNCTNDVIAALCHLFPDGSKVADTSGALPLHIAAGHPSVVSSKKKKSAEAEISKTIGILVEANPSALVSRDGHGKTPLHCLLDHHADTRNLATVQLLSRIVDEKVWKFEVEAKAEEENEKVLMPIPSIIRKKLPKEVNSKVNFFTPASALVIPDSLVGAIPLHYAVKNGISKDIVAFLIKAYPSSVCHIDCNAHTPLHWIFGAHKDNKKVPAHHVYRSASVISMLLQRDLTQTYNVATMKDMNENGEPHRTPLHYAVGLLAKNIIDPIPSKGEISSSCITLKSLQALIDADSKALITRDSLGQTPLHVLFRTVFEMHEADYKKALQIAKTGEKCALLKEPKAFSPPKVLLSLLIEGTPQESINPATIQDIRGMLPLHCAVLAVSSPTVLGALIDHNPRSLTHLSSTSSSEFISKYYDLLPSEDAFYVNSFEGSRTPLHMAYANPFFINSYTDAMIQKLLFYDSAVSNTRKSDNDSRIKIDASIALKMQDSHGDTPLHLAAKNNANIERLSNLLQRDHLASMTLNEDGDLPLHLLLDEHFLFVNIELALAHSGSLGASNSLEKLNNTEFRDKVRDLAKKQTVAIRMAKFQLSGAIFAPSNGWSTNEEESNEKNQIELMKKMNLLGMPLVNNEGCLRAACSKHGLLPIHILVAFHAVPYQVISSMIRKAPNSVNHTSHLDGYTALDIHLFRRSVPGEIKKYEVDAWKAIRQLLFSHGLFPLENIADLNSGGIQISRNDRDFIADCEQQILAEITSQHDKAYHIRGNHPIEPSHLLFGFLKNFKTDDQLPDEHELSQVCYNIWIFMACYYNLSNPDDNYAESLKHIFAELDFSSIEMLTELNIPMDTFRNTLAESPSYSVEKHANVFCKADIYSNSFFAGSYTFNAPSNGASILLHREKSGQSILVQATKKVFNIHRKDNDQSWMFVPGSDVRFRSDYSLADVSVCFKFMKNKSTYQRELNWRTELGDLSGHQSIIPIIDSYDIDCAEETSRYVKDRQDQRFRKLPMRSKSVRSDTTEWLNLTQYPFAIVHPMSVDGNLLNVLSRGLIDTSSLKGIIADLGNVLKEIHGKGMMNRISFL
jgi:ankyrin repeat protein